MIVTVFKDRAGFELAEYNMAWPDLVDWIKRPPVAASKSELPLIKLARFGDVRSKRGSLRHDRNVLGVHGIEHFGNRLCSACRAHTLGMVEAGNPGGRKPHK